MWRERTTPVAVEWMATAGGGAELLGGALGAGRANLASWGFLTMMA